jgi:hypothetical protein
MKYFCVILLSYWLVVSLYAQNDELKLPFDKYIELCNRLGSNEIDQSVVIDSLIKTDFRYFDYLLRLIECGYYHSSEPELKYIKKIDSLYAILNTPHPYSVSQSAHEEFVMLSCLGAGFLDKKYALKEEPWSFYDTSLINDLNVNYWIAITKAALSITRLDHAYKADIALTGWIRSTRVDSIEALLLEYVLTELQKEKEWQLRDVVARPILAPYIRKGNDTDIEFLRPLIELNNRNRIWLINMLSQESGNKFYPKLLLDALKSNEEAIAYEALGASTNCWDQNKKTEVESVTRRIFVTSEGRLKERAAFNLFHGYADKEAYFYISELLTEPSKTYTAACWLGDAQIRGMKLSDDEKQIIRNRLKKQLEYPHSKETIREIERTLANVHLN